MPNSYYMYSVNMIKKKQLSPPEKNKKISAPYFSQSFDTILKKSMRAEERKLMSVQIATSPYIGNDRYRDNYLEIFGHD